MTCQCTSGRIIHICAKHDDRFGYKIPHLNIDTDGYAPYLKQLGIGGDYTRMKICLDCGKIQGFTSVSDEEIEDTVNDN